MVLEKLDNLHAIHGNEIANVKFLTEHKLYMHLYKNGLSLDDVRTRYQIQKNDTENQRKHNIIAKHVAAAKECLLRLDDEYSKVGMSALLSVNLENMKIYHVLYRAGYKQEELLERYGIDLRSWEKFKDTALNRWSKDRIFEEARIITNELGYFPPAQWFSENQRGSFIQACYENGLTWDEIRNEIGAPLSSAYVESRNGFRWRSHPEASLSNYLYARSIIHKKGERYPESYSDFSGKRFGYYDMHVLINSGSWLDIEIWGDKPAGHAEAKYLEVRTAKETFNAYGNFLGIDFRDCFSDAKLDEILSPYLGIIAPHTFDRPTDKLIESSHWSNADELLEACRKIADEQSGGIFPTEGWLRKRGNYENRDGPTYNTISIYIKLWLGGIRNLRKLLSQGEHSTRLWDNSEVISQTIKVFEKYNNTPGAIVASVRLGKIDIPESERKSLQNLNAAIHDRFGNTRSLLEHIKRNYPDSPISSHKIRGANANH